MAEEIAFENRRIYNIQRPVTSTLTLDRVILHTVVVHHSSTSTYKPNFIEIDDERKYGRTFETHFIRSAQKSRPKKGHK